MQRLAVGAGVTAFIGIQGFLCVSVIQQGNMLAHIEERLNTATDLRYRATDAERDFRLRDQALSMMERRLSRLEGYHKEDDVGHD